MADATGTVSQPIPNVIVIAERPRIGLQRLWGRGAVALGRRQCHLGPEGCPKYSSVCGRHPAPDRVPPTQEFSF
jgi:hypothetical protein